MALGNTGVSNFIIPELWLDAVAGALPGMSVIGKIGAVRIETTLPGGIRPGTPVSIPYFGSIGRMQVLADLATIDVTQLTMTDESSTVLRAGIAVNMSEMARRLAGYADPYGEAARQFVAALQQHANVAALGAANAAGLPTGNVLDVHDATVPVYLDRDTVIEARMRWGDEQDGIAGLTVHSATMKTMLSLKDGDGQPLMRVLEQDDASGVVRFEGLPPVYPSDLNPVEFPITATGTTPPTVTVSGYAFGDFDLRLEITTLGARGTALFRWSIDAGNTWEASGVVTAAEVELGDTGLSAAFAVGTYAADNVYVCRDPVYTSLLLKKDSILFWTDPPVDDELKSPLQFATLRAVNQLYVSHRYKRMPGRTKAGVVRIKHNNKRPR